MSLCKITKQSQNNLHLAQYNLYNKFSILLFSKREIFQIVYNTCFFVWQKLLSPSNFEVEKHIKSHIGVHIWKLGLLGNCFEKHLLQFCHHNV